MNVWLSLPAPETDTSETLATVDVSARLRRVAYEETVAKIRAYSGRVTGLFIPRTLNGIDYDFRYLIEHIRIDQDDSIARLPIVVSVDIDDEFLNSQDADSEFREAFYRNIAVVLSLNPTPADLHREIDDYAWDKFQITAGAEPFYDKGRHDRANAWGAYVVLKVLNTASLGKSQLSHGIKEETSALECKLLEDTFYKRRIQKLRGTEIEPKLLVDLRRERTQFLSGASSDESILIVEDQLADGWKAAYAAAFIDEGVNRNIIFVEDVDSAKTHFNQSLMLIVLDVRLSSDRHARCQEEQEQSIGEMAGVRLAEWFKKQGNTAPIIAATASNKSWTLEALLAYGINNYWIKASPDSSATLAQATQNVLDLYKKLNRVREWANKTRVWVEGLYRLADIVFAHDQVNGRRILAKAKSLHALLFQSFSPFQKDMSQGLQLNLAFILIYSCMNDLVSWILDKESLGAGEGTTWYLDGEDGRCAIVTATVHTDKLSDSGWKYLRHDTGETRHDFPDSGAALDVMRGLRLMSLSRRFRSLSKIRNGLPLIHGKADQTETTAKIVDRVSEMDIADIVDVLLTLAKAKDSRLAAQVRTL